MKRKPHTMFLNIGIAIFSIAVFLAVSCTNAQRDGSEAEPDPNPSELDCTDAKVPLGVGDKAPDFILETVDGRSVIFSEVVAESDGVVLWLTNLCGGCQGNMPAMQDLYLEYGEGVEILAVSQLGEDVATVNKAVTDYGLTFPFLIDPAGEVTGLYGFEYIPNSCPSTNIHFIDDNGIIESQGHYPGMGAEGLADKIEILI
ncbi:MAG: redoxin domain-containing protein [bacterium]|nr:redoxin domain-containing protein [bacterium]